MKTSGILSYAPLFGLVALACGAWAIDPIDHKPIAELAAALKSSGQVRIAQGVQDVVAKDISTGEVFTTRSPLMVTTNTQTGEWTISVVNDKVVGSTLLIGTKLLRVPTGAAALPTFNREKAAAVITELGGWSPCYYPDEIVRYTKDGFQRVFTGRIDQMTEPAFKAGMKPVFADVVVNADGVFGVLIVDQYGACAKLAFGGTFSDKL